MTDIDAAGDDHPGNRRADHAVAQIDAIPFQLRLGQFDLGHGGVNLLASDVQLLPGHQILALECGHPFDLDLRQIQRRLAGQHVRLALLDLGLEQRRIEFGQHLILLHRVVEIRVNFPDRAGHLGADVNDHDRIQRPIGGDDLDDVAPVDGLGTVTLGGLRRIAGPVGVSGEAGGQRQDDQQQANLGGSHWRRVKGVGGRSRWRAGVLWTKVK